MATHAHPLTNLQAPGRILQAPVSEERSSTSLSRSVRQPHCSHEASALEFDEQPMSWGGPAPNASTTQYLHGSSSITADKPPSAGKRKWDELSSLEQERGRTTSKRKRSRQSGTQWDSSHIDGPNSFQSNPLMGQTPRNRLHVGQAPTLNAPTASSPAFDHGMGFQASLQDYTSTVAPGDSWGHSQELQSHREAKLGRVAELDSSNPSSATIEANAASLYGPHDESWLNDCLGLPASSNQFESQSEKIACSQPGCLTDAMALKHLSVNDCCDLPCGEACDTDDCSTCDGSSECSESCDNPDLCQSGRCDDPGCWDGPDSACEGHHPPAPQFNNVAQPCSYVDPRHLTLNCHWETSGKHCEASMPSPNTLSQHILQDHIQPQASLPCQWVDCGDRFDADDISSHVWQCHSPIHHTDSYVCLWHRCGASFATTEELDMHMKTSHCLMSCHWHGCEEEVTSETALKVHVDVRHITEAEQYISATSSPSSRSISSPCTPQMTPVGSREEVVDVDHIAAAAVKHQGSKPRKLTTNETKKRQSRSTAPLGQISPGNAGPKVCQWTLAGGVCGKVFPDGNALQSHVESSHVHESKRYSTSSRPNLCCWKGCRANCPFSERSKLARHMYIHTKFMVGACKHCGKEYNNQNQLTDHERTHTKEKPFTCDHCGFSATNKAALTTHMRTHTGEKPLKCDRCTYTCGDPSNMSKHRKTHEAPLYKCELCEKAFCRMATLKRHMRSHEDKGG